MYINKLIKKQLLLGIVSIFLIAIIVFGSSFALFETSVSNSTDQTISVGDLDIVFTGGSEINSTGLKPMTDQNALSETDNVYTFTMKNEGTLNYSYDISLITNPAYLPGGNNYNANRNLLDLKYLRYQLNEETIGSLNDSNVIHMGAIEPSETKNFTLRIWLADAEEYILPNEVLGAELHLSIIVDGQVVSESN